VRGHRHPGPGASELDGALATAFATDGPALVHVHADAELV
jgi:thiamine pyrophosphate-dependent acetolactate synthase large subunit-like protein